MEVKITSTETIKPSKPYPPDHGLKTHKLSLLDHRFPLIYTPMVFFYPMNPHFEVARLKRSLSETLGHLRLLAGRIKDGTIYCNDEGAVFLEAKVNVSLSEVLTNLQLELIDRLCPCGIRCSAELPELAAPIIVQVNVFECGGIAIGACFLHKIIDGMTMSYFLKSWASITKGSFQKPAEFDYSWISDLFPQRELGFVSYSNSSSNTTSIKRIVFAGKEISNLKFKAQSKIVPNPTTVEVVTAILWKYALKAAWKRSGSQKASTLGLTVDLRKRTNPPLPENSIGNLFWTATSHFDGASAEIPLDELVGLLRKSISEIDADFVQSFKSDEGFLRISESMDEVKQRIKNSRSYTFSSWRNMGLNEVEFGWGKPIWVSPGGIADPIIVDCVVFKESQDGDGIEAWIALDEEEMKILANDEAFLACASLDPPVRH